MIITLSMALPSHHQIGDEVFLHPNPWRQTTERNSGFLCRVDKVNFRSGKVTYDLALHVVEGDGEGNLESRYYDAITIKDVDSSFVYSIKDLEEKDHTHESS